MREAKLDVADLSEEPTLRRRLPPDYRDVPRDVDVTLFGGMDEVELVRSVTEQERQRLERVIPDDGEHFFAVYTSATEAYRVAAGSKPESMDLYQVGAGGRGISPQHVEELGIAQGCWNWCGACASWAASKGICYGSCFLAATLAGAVLCVLCIANPNIALIWAFEPCANCFQNCAPV